MSRDGRAGAIVALVLAKARSWASRAAKGHEEALPGPWANTRVRSTKALQ